MIRGKTAEKAEYLLIVPAVKCWTCPIPSRISSRHNTTVPRMSAIKKIGLRAGERLIGVRLVEGVEIFLFATAFRPGVWSIHTLTRGFYPVYKWATHVHLVLKDNTGTLPVFFHTPLLYGAWLRTRRAVPFSQPLQLQRVRYFTLNTR